MPTAKKAAKMAAKKAKAGKATTVRPAPAARQPAAQPAARARAQRANGARPFENAKAKFAKPLVIVRPPPAQPVTGGQARAAPPALRMPMMPSGTINNIRVVPVPPAAAAGKAKSVHVVTPAPAPTQAPAQPATQPATQTAQPAAQPPAARNPRARVVAPPRPASVAAAPAKDAPQPQRQRTRMTRRRRVPPATTAANAAAAAATSAAAATANAANGAIPSGFFSRIANLFTPAKPAPAAGGATATAATATATAPTAAASTAAPSGPAASASAEKKPGNPPSPPVAASAGSQSGSAPASGTAGKAKSGKDFDTDSSAAAAPVTMSGPLDASQLPDLTVSAPILDSDDFKAAVRSIISQRHPNGALVPVDVLTAIIEAVTLQVDTVSPMLFGPLLVSILKQVDSVKVVKNNRPAKMLLTMELFKAIVQTAYSTAGIPIPDGLRWFAGSTLDSFLAVIIKKDASIVDSAKLQSLVSHQLDKIARRAIFLSKLQASREEQLKAK